jgi:hypothetical protein
MALLAWPWSLKPLSQARPPGNIAGRFDCYPTFKSARAQRFTSPGAQPGSGNVPHNVLPGALCRYFFALI